MILRKTSIYDKFICTADKCPENCCRGWRIHIDDDTVQKYLDMKGFKGIALRLFMHTDDTMPYFSKRAVRCPLMSHDRFCLIQRHIGEECMPEICRRFPRDIRNYGEFAEFHLDLSCTEAAAILLNNSGSVSLLEYEGETDFPRYGNNDDAEFLSRLCDSRKKMLSLFDECSGNIFWLDGAFKKALDIAFSDHERILSVKDTGRMQEIPGDVFPLSMEVLNEMINNSLYKDEMRYYSSFYYKLFKLYFKYFDDLSPLRADHVYRAMLGRLLENVPEIAGNTIEYVRYSIEREYLTTYEDYSFIKRILDTLICSNIILLLQAVYFEHYGKLPVKSRARIISLTERRARHNDYILRRLSDVFKLESSGYFSGQFAGEE